ncbi:unannotated protein [freshwater metagenome]|uniref:Unannotated protein n=1 Tax=freshwater metagenome TaxID=449393 RepID=A0A6J7IA69_9ZZZZ|nr:hypothetical protein [Actinomycetota bacterium]
MPTPDMAARPRTVTFAAIMMLVAAIGYAVGVVVCIWLLANPQDQSFYGREVSDWFWVFQGVLDLALVFGFVWIARLALRGEYGAGMTITMLAALNIFFSLFSLLHVYGAVELILSVAVLIANLSPRAQAWYVRNLPTAG